MSRVLRGGWDSVLRGAHQKSKFVALLIVKDTFSQATFDGNIWLDLSVGYDVLITAPSTHLCDLPSLHLSHGADSVWEIIRS